MHLLSKFNAKNCSSFRWIADIFIDLSELIFNTPLAFTPSIRCHRRRYPWILLTPKCTKKVTLRRRPPVHPRIETVVLWGVNLVTGSRDPQVLCSHVTQIAVSVIPHLLHFPLPMASELLHLSFCVAVRRLFEQKLSKPPLWESETEWKCAVKPPDATAYAILGMVYL